MKVEDVMTRDVTTVSPEATLREVAKTLAEGRIAGVPAVDDRRVVGVVSEGDIVTKETGAAPERGLLDWPLSDRAPSKLEARTVGEAMRPDDELEREIGERVLLQTLWIDPASLDITFRDGEVSLAGDVENKADADLLAYFASRVPGVVSVRSDIR